MQLQPLFIPDTFFWHSGRILTQDQLGTIREVQHTRKLVGTCVSISIEDVLYIHTVSVCTGMQGLRCERGIGRIRCCEIPPFKLLPP